MTKLQTALKEKAVLEKALDIASRSRVKICCHDYAMSNHPGKCVCSPKGCQAYMKSEFIRLAKAKAQGGR